MVPHQKFTFPPKNYRNVASPPADDLPEHRITLRAEDLLSCSTSHWIKFSFENRFIFLICEKFHEKLKKIGFSKNFQIFHFFASADATNFLIFTLQIIYREAQHFLRMTALIWHPRKWNKIENRTDGPSPKIHISTKKIQKCRKPPGWRFARTPYYSSSRGLTILLYESLNWYFIWKLLCVFKIFNKFHKKLKKIGFFKKLQIFHFFPSADATFVRNFNLQIIYREAQHFLRISALIWHPRK